ncbi:zinc-ribbon domain-containing protein [Avibacterium paragallinarum]|uniref:Zinc-ribbon domain-containing protein n=1 Tax=Avibacterium paragallinarum TaxID=728 RepID=A0A380X6Y2_AVIPA|nr:zinc-ribbon domain-containing protein [Avibacterium paragallinarum]SUU98407.1 Uncharacterised protein [Avibacterium paragallinarum]
MYCGNCGKPIDKEQNYCSYCGKMQKSLAKNSYSPHTEQSPPPPHDDDTVAFDKIFAKNNVSLKDRCLALSGEFFLNFWIILLLFGIPFGILGTSLSSDQMALLFLVEAILFIALRPIFYASKKKGIFGSLLGISLKTDYNESISLKRYIMRIAVKVVLIFILTAIGYILTISLFIADSKFGTPIFSRALLPFLGFGGIPIFLYFISFFLSKKTTPRLFYDKWLGVYVQKTTAPKWGGAFTHIFLIINTILFLLITLQKYSPDTLSGLVDKLAHRDHHITDCINAYDQKQYELAASSCLLAKDSGNGEVLNVLGELYTLGNGVPQDYQKAKY